jgi:hypothetical protein
LALFDPGFKEKAAQMQGDVQFSGRGGKFPSGLLALSWLGFQNYRAARFGPSVWAACRRAKGVE